MSCWRAANVILPIIDFIAPVPVFLLYLRARLPFVVLLVSMVVAVSDRVEWSIFKKQSHQGSKVCNASSPMYTIV